MKRITVFGQVSVSWDTTDFETHSIQTSFKEDRVLVKELVDKMLSGKVIEDSISVVFKYSTDNFNRELFASERIEEIAKMLGINIKAELGLLKLLDDNQFKDLKFFNVVTGRIQFPSHVKQVIPYEAR